MTRSLSQLCYAALMMVSRLVIFTACLSVTVTFIASCTLNDSQLDSLTDVVRNMTKMLSYIGITVGSFLLGAAFNRIQRERKQKKEQQHAAVLQAATRRMLEWYDRFVEVFVRHREHLVAFQPRLTHCL